MSKATHPLVGHDAFRVDAPVAALLLRLRLARLVVRVSVLVVGPLRIATRRIYRSRLL